MSLIHQLSPREVGRRNSTQIQFSSVFALIGSVLTFWWKMAWLKFPEKTITIFKLYMSFNHLPMPGGKCFKLSSTWFTYFWSVLKRYHRIGRKINVFCKIKSYAHGKGEKCGHCVQARELKPNFLLKEWKLRKFFFPRLETIQTSWVCCFDHNLNLFQISTLREKKK